MPDAVCFLRNRNVGIADVFVMIQIDIADYS